MQWLDVAGTAGGQFQKGFTFIAIEIMLKHFATQNLKQQIQSIIETQNLCSVYVS